MDDVELISRDEVTEYLFTVLDMRADLHEILTLLGGGEDGEIPETDA